MQVSEQTIFDGTDSFLSLKHLVLRGTNFEIGQTLAEMALEKQGQAAIPLPASRAIRGCSIHAGRPGSGCTCCPTLEFSTRGPSNIYPNQ